MLRKDSIKLALSGQINPSVAELPSNMDLSCRIVTNSRDNKAALNICKVQSSKEIKLKSKF